MSFCSGTPFLDSLASRDDAAWAEVRDAIRPAMHAVDRNATDVWFTFFPVVLARALDQASDPERLARKLALSGKYRLSEQIDTSHRFLYGHRYWPQAKAAVKDAASPGVAPAGSLADLVRTVARAAAASANVGEDLTLGVAAVACATLQQVGWDAFVATPGTIALDGAVARRTPGDVLATRARERRQGLMGLLRSIDRRHTVTFDESRAEAAFPAVHGQDLTMAGAEDRRDYQSADPRCVEGPIPIECRTAACGTCWVGVLGGERNLSEVEDREWRKMKEFGYLDTDDPLPVVRLACRTRVLGSCSIVVPPWNGVFGKLVEGKLDPKEEEGATASA